jgi:putative ABC transport system permease protein
MINDRHLGEEQIGRAARGAAIRMKTPLAWLNLLHQRARSSVAVAGVAFAVVLVLLQLGFLASVRQTATRIYDHLDFDLLLASPEYLHLSKASTIPRSRLTQAASLPGVTGTSGLNIGFQLWRNVETGQRRGILLMAFDPRDRVIALPEVADQQEQLGKADTVLVDRLSRSEFGPKQAGVTAEVGRRSVHVTGDFALGTGFSADGALLASNATFFRLLPFRKPGEISLGLVRLAPGTDPDAVAAELRSILPRDVHVMTRDEIAAHERRHWMTKTSVGIIFGLGVLVALLVGTSIVYQVLSSDISSRLAEFATLKAMGYSRQYLSWLVLQQALILALAGFLPGLLLAEMLYQLTERMTHIPIEMTLTRACGVLLLSVVMCGLSGLASMAKVNSADPADLF